MKNLRNLYVKNKEKCITNNMSDSIINNNSIDFWNQVKKGKCSVNSLPNDIDNCCGK